MFSDVTMPESGRTFNRQDRFCSIVFSEAILSLAMSSHSQAI